MSKYNVPIVFRGQANYIIEAASPAEAERIARARFNEGDKGDDYFEKTDYVGEIEEVHE